MRKQLTPFIVAFILLGLLLAGCGNGNKTATKQRKQAIAERAAAFSRAEKVSPTFKPTNFPLRKALNEFTERQDQLNHPWYIYLLGENGNAVSYYVGKTVPINACDFLSSTEDVKTVGANDAAVVLTAPSLDGVYYGGSGASSGCDSWFFFDQATNALIQIRGVHWYASDRPLKVDAAPIKVAGSR